MQKKFIQVLWLFLGMGFVLGVVYENVIYIRNQNVVSFFRRESLEQVIQREIISGEYFLYVVRMRLRMIVPCCMIGLVKWKKIFINLFLLWNGFLFGIFLVDAIMIQRIVGIVLCLVMLFPHMIFYVLGAYLVLWNFYIHPEQRWNMQKVVVCILLFLIGILAETYVNPWLIKGILKWLQ